jgi:NitT/TauT family transport system ATP-binding protein
MLDVRGLKKVYEGSGRRVEAVRDLTFTVEAGELVCLVGPSGCGKTTLLKCVAGLLTPTAGEVLVGGRGVSGPPPDMAVVFQEYGRSLFPWMRVRENVELPLKQKKLTAARRRELVADALASVGLTDAAGAYPWQLSGGMQQRVSIARALGFEPKLLMMDEPFGALDEITRDRLNEQLLRLWERERRTVVFVTHSIPEAVFLSSRIVVMSPRPGRIVDVIESDLPADRTLDIRDTTQFTDIAHRVRVALREGHGEH